MGSRSSERRGLLSPASRHRTVGPVGRRTVAAAAAAVLCAGIASCSTPASGNGTGGSDASHGTIKIGAIMSQTGIGSVIDKPALQGLKLAVSKVNANGGVEVGGTKHKVSLLAEDARSDATTAVAAARKLHSREGVNVFFVGSQSLIDDALEQYAKTAKVLYFACNTTLQAQLGGPGTELMFRSFNSATDIANKFIPKAVKAMGIQGGVDAIFPNEDVGRQIINSAQKPFADAGSPVKSSELFQTGTTNFSPVLQNVRNNPGVGGLYIGYQSSQINDIIEQAVTLGNVPTKFITYGGFGDTAQTYGSKIDGYAWTSFTREVAFSKDSALLAWVSQYEKANSLSSVTSEDAYALSTYDPFLALMSAMSAKGTTTDLSALAGELHKACYHGVRTICWDGQGRASADFDMGIDVRGQMTVTTVPATVPPGNRSLKSL